MKQAIAAFKQQISTHTPLAGRDDIILNGVYDAEISTHTPLAGRDPCPLAFGIRIINFYSHAPRGT